MELTIYVPTGPTHIDPGSAVTGAHDPDPATGRIRVDYEGDRFGAYRHLDPSERFYANLRRAGGRHIEKYPTIARAWYTAENITAVGWYNATTGTVTIDDHDLFNTWAAPATADGVEAAARTEQHRRYLDDLGQRIGRGDVDAMIEVATLRNQPPRP